jgi:hypothetical protein
MAQATEVPLIQVARHWAAPARTGVAAAVASFRVRMTPIRLPQPVLLIVASFSRHIALLEEAGRHLEDAFGPIALASLPYPFTQTTYYEPSMGPELKKLFFVFQNLVSADSLAAAKIRTNELERTLADAGAYPEKRPINLDPGILTLGKFMLATTKDQAHRIYQRDGIYAEVTLRFEAGAYAPWPWTYADYRQPAVLAFLSDARALYRSSLAEQKAASREGEGR